MDRGKFERDWAARQLAAGVYDEPVLCELVRQGARAIQSEAGLEVDGLAGPKTITHIESELGLIKQDRKVRGGRRKIVRPDLMPVPARKNIEAVYGSFSFETHPTMKGAIIIEKSWVKRNIKQCLLPEFGQRTPMHHLIIEEFKEAYTEAVKNSGYLPEKMWSWVPRRINWSADPDKPLSCHSWGVAFDIDWHLQPYGSKTGPIYDHPRFVAAFESRGWVWGGRWRTPDPHHFQRVK